MALQALFAREMAEALGWQDLTCRLRTHGCAFIPDGGGLTLYKRSCGTRVCNASDLGFTYRTLVARFGAGMPGHPQGSLNLTFDADCGANFKGREPG